MTKTRTPARPRKPPRSQPPGSIRLTGRGALVSLFAVCFLGLLVAAWTGWSALADALFVMACGAVTWYTRDSGLRLVVVCPPLAFFAGSILAQAITAPDAFSVVTGILITMGTSAPWLFAGTALTVAIAFGRGWRPELQAFGALREALREVLRR
jgi:hypothetical protein